MNPTPRPRSIRKTRTGKIVRISAGKTVLVEIQGFTEHPRYGKRLRRRVRLLARGGRVACAPGDVVELIESRPLSRRIRWRVSRLVRSVGKTPAAEGAS